MADVFTVLAKDHEEVKRMLAELEKGPTQATEASQDQLAQRKTMTEQLIIEESKHEALEEMYFWPAVREHHPAGNTLADDATGQEQEAKEVLDKLDKLDVGDPEFDKLLGTFTGAARKHIAFEETQVWPGPALGAARRDSGRPGHQDRRREEDRADAAAPALSPVAGRTQDGRARGRRGRQGARQGNRPGQRLTRSRERPARHRRRTGGTAAGLPRGPGGLAPGQVRAPLSVRKDWKMIPNGHWCYELSRLLAPALIAGSRRSGPRWSSAAVGVGAAFARPALVQDPWPPGRDGGSARWP